MLQNCHHLWTLTNATLSASIFGNVSWHWHWYIASSFEHGNVINSGTLRPFIEPTSQVPATQLDDINKMKGSKYMFCSNTKDTLWLILSISMTDKKWFLTSNRCIQACLPSERDRQKGECPIFGKINSGIQYTQSFFNWRSEHTWYGVLHHCRYS